MAFGSPPDSPWGIGPVNPPGGNNLLTDTLEPCRLILMNLTTAQTIIRSEMHAHGLTQTGWRFEWDRAKNRNGQCRYADRVISLSAPRTQLRDEAWVRMTIIHEIAHALVGPGYGHGHIWKAKFRSLGGDGSRCSSDAIDREALSKYAIKCSVDLRTLGHVNRKGKRLATSVCKCHMAPLKWVTLR